MMAQPPGAPYMRAPFTHLGNVSNPSNSNGNSSSSSSEMSAANGINAYYSQNPALGQTLDRSFQSNSSNNGSEGSPHSSHVARPLPPPVPPLLSSSSSSSSSSSLRTASGPYPGAAQKLAVPWWHNDNSSNSYSGNGNGRGPHTGQEQSSSSSSSSSSGPTASSSSFPSSSSSSSHGQPRAWTSVYEGSVSNNHSHLSHSEGPRGALRCAPPLSAAPAARPLISTGSESHGTTNVTTMRSNGASSSNWYHYPNLSPDADNPYRSRSYSNHFLSSGHASPTVQSANLMMTHDDSSMTARVRENAGFDQ